MFLTNFIFQFQTELSLKAIFLCLALVTWFVVFLLVVCVCCVPCRAIFACRAKKQSKRSNRPFSLLCKRERFDIFHLSFRVVFFLKKKSNKKSFIKMVVR